MGQRTPSRGRIARRFWPHVRGQSWLIGGAFLALFAQVFLRLLEPWPLKIVFDEVLLASSAGGRSRLPAVDALGPTALLVVAVLALVAIAGLRALASYGSTVGFALAGNRVLTDVRNALYSHLQCLSLSFHTRARSGDLVVRVMGDVGLLKDVAVTAALPLIGSALILVSMVGVMFWVHWQLTLLALAPLPLFWASTLRVSRRIKEVSRKQRQREGSMAATAVEAMGAIRTVQALSLEKTFSRAFATQSVKSLKEGVQARRLAARLERTTDLFVAVATGLVVLYGAHLVLGGELTPGDLLVFLAYLKSGFRPAQDFAKYTGRLAKAMAAGERVIEVLERVPEIRDLPGAVPAPPFAGAVRFEQVDFAYDSGTVVLEGTDLDLRPREMVALVGPSGIGKSTIASLILRLYEPSGGRILIDGRDLREYTLESLRAQISVVLQDGPLFAGSVTDNIALGAPGVSVVEVQAAAQLVNADQFIDLLPRGFETIVGERGATLSQGQRQRLALARAAVRDAPLLILDEPTTGLDEENERAVVEALSVLCQRRTVLLITHDLGLAARADRILYLESGRIVEQGTHAELMATHGRYAHLFRLQAASRAEHAATTHAVSR